MSDDEIQTKFTELERRVQALEAGQIAPGSAATGATKKQLSLREFLNQKKPTTANDRGLAIAYYNETVRGYDYFNAEDIKVGFRDARIPAPKNINDVINKNITKGYMTGAEQSKAGKKAWVLTGTGLETVEKGFAKGGR